MEDAGWSKVNGSHYLWTHKDGHELERVGAAWVLRPKGQTSRKVGWDMDKALRSALELTKPEEAQAA